MRLRLGESRNGEQQSFTGTPVLPEYEADKSDPDFDDDMAEAIVAARRTEFAALSDLNDAASWDDLD